MSLANYYKIILSQKRPLRFLLSRLIWRSGLSHHFYIRRNGYKLIFFPTSISANMWQMGVTERSDSEHIIQNILREGDTFIDIGANIGSIAIPGKIAVGNSGRVFAIEANPNIYNYLNKNIKLNNLEINTFCCAVGDEKGELFFSNLHQDDQNSISQDGEIKVPVEKLDDIIHGLDRVRLIKIDVEGFELKVVKGAEEIISNTQYLMFECWDQHFQKYGYRSEDLLDYLRGLKFKIFNIADGQIGSEIVFNSNFEECVDLIAVNEDILQ